MQTYTDGTFFIPLMIIRPPILVIKKSEADRVLHTPVPYGTFTVKSALHPIPLVYCSLHTMQYTGGVKKMQPLPLFPTAPLLQYTIGV